MFDYKEILQVSYRALISLVTLFLITKLLGKKQVSQLSLFDYVIGISIGNFAAEVTINLEAEWINGVVAVTIFGVYRNKDNTKEDLTKLTVAEVAHSIFYAPQYVAISEGYFEDEGIDIDLILTPGADAVTAAALSGDAQIGFSGTEATIYVYNGGEKDYPMVFAALTKRDGSFLVSREKIDNFTLEDLKGKTVIGGRRGYLN